MASEKKKSAGLKAQSVGLLMIAGSLVVIALISYQFLTYSHAEGQQQVRSQGVSMSKLLAEMPIAQLTSQGTRNSLNILYRSQVGSSLAYAVVFNKQGKLLSQVAADGVVVPQTTIGQEPSSWNGERHVELGDGKRATEFYSPVLENGNFYGSARVAYFEPELVPSMESIPLLASLALPIFLLTPMFYFLMRRQIKPLRETQEIIARQMTAGAGTKVELEASGEMSEFIENFNHYCRTTSDKIQKLEYDKNSMLASTKVLGYKFNRVESVLEALPDGVLVFDDAGAIQFANQKMGVLFAIELSKVLEQPLASWCPNERVFQFLSRSSAASNRSAQEMRLEVVQGDKSRMLALNAFPLFASADDNSSKGTLVIVRDRSHEVNAEASREEFVAHISHELKTPLNTLMMYSEALVGPDGQDPQFRAEGLNVVHDEAERMSELISNLLSITKIEMGSMNIDRQRVKFTEFVTDAFEGIKKSAHDSDLEFEINLPGDTIPVAVDKSLMSIALNNLLTNAVKYNQPNGKVTLDMAENDSTVSITVTDTGIGIAKEELSKIFDKFYRSDSDEVRDRAGHGLGLSLAADIVRLHNGQLTVSSTPGAGTSFTMILRKESELLKRAS